MFTEGVHFVHLNKSETGQRLRSETQDGFENGRPQEVNRLKLAGEPEIKTLTETKRIHVLHI